MPVKLCIAWQTSKPEVMVAYERKVVSWSVIVSATSLQSIIAPSGYMGHKQNLFSLIVNQLDQYKKRRPNYCFDPIFSNTEVGPPFPIVICRENGGAIVRNSDHAASLILLFCVLYELGNINIFPSDAYL